jgi:phosphopantothenoylcysteine decarboxylase/phosphopantothenate--cysteine ligase
VEDIDPIRFLSNRSSGKMGYAVAQMALQRGAEVFLVSGPTSLRAPSGAQFIPVRSAAQMKDAVLKLYPEMDVVVKAAAVSDYRAVELSAQKIKKGSATINLSLIQNDDILELLGRQKKNQVLVGFAAETEYVLESGKKKLEQKNLDLLVANDVSRGVFGSDSSSVYILSRSGDTVTLQEQSKLEIAGKILDLARNIKKTGDRRQNESY